MRLQQPQALRSINQSTETKLEAQPCLSASPALQAADRCQSEEQAIHPLHMLQPVSLESRSGEMYEQNKNDEESPMTYSDETIVDIISEAKVTKVKMSDLEVPRQIKVDRRRVEALKESNSKEDKTQTFLGIYPLFLHFLFDMYFT